MINLAARSLDLVSSRDLVHYPKWRYPYLKPFLSYLTRITLWTTVSTDFHKYYMEAMVQLSNGNRAFETVAHVCLVSQRALLSDNAIKIFIRFHLLDRGNTVLFLIMSRIAKVFFGFY